MKIGVALKINVSKIDKAKIFKGEKGSYLDMTCFIDVGQADTYGKNGMITQSVSKEERDAGVKGNILGNVKVFFNDQAQSTPSQANQNFQAPDDFEDDLDKLPF